MFSHSPRGQKSKIQVSAESFLSGGSKGESVACFSPGSRGSSGPSIAGTLLSPVCLRLHMPSPQCLCSPFLYLIKPHGTEIRVHSHPEPSHLKIFNLHLQRPLPKWAHSQVASRYISLGVLYCYDHYHHYYYLCVYMCVCIATICHHTKLLQYYWLYF